MIIFINSIKYNSSLVDGPGVRTVVFLQGCDIRCKGCHNQSAWDIAKGIAMESENLANLLKEKVVNKKVTISGGEPLMQKDAVLELLDLLQGFDIALYTGHELIDVPVEILQKVNYIKTGNFQIDKKTSVKPYVGSYNQEFRRVENAKVQ